MLHGVPIHLGRGDHGPAPSDVFEIRIATRPLPIRIEYAAIRSLHSVITAQDPSLGLLLGTPSPEGLSVDHCEQLPRDAATPEGFTTARSKHPAQRVVGFFRTQASGWPEMQKADRDIAKRCFQHRGSLFLLIQTPAHRPWSAALFDLDAESASPTKTPALEFFFDERLLRNVYSEALVPGGEHQALVDPPLARPRTYWVVGAVLGAILLLGVAGYQWFAARDRGQPASVSPAASPLALKVVRSGQDFEVSWDHLAPALQQASGGSVTVRDGQITRTVPLNTAQLREGRILYTPLFGDLNFRLEIEQGARTQAESVQVLSWNANSASEFLANLQATPPVPGVPPLSAPPSSPPRPSPSRAAADARLSPMTGKPQTPAVPSIPRPVKQIAPVPVYSTRVFVTPQALERPAAVQETSPAKSSAIVPAPLPPVVPVTPVGQPSSSPDKPPEAKSAGLPSAPPPGAGFANNGSAPSEVRSTAPPSAPPPGAGSASNGTTPSAEKPAVSPNPVAPPAPASAAPKANNAPVSVPLPGLARTQSPDPKYLPPVAVTRTLPKITREVKRALNLAGGQVKLSVRVTVDTDGNVRNAEVLPESETPTFVDFLIIKSAALDAAKHWKFRPGALNGKVVTSDVNIEFRFQ